jgi:hypothetical protein
MSTPAVSSQLPVDHTPSKPAKPKGKRRAKPKGKPPRILHHDNEVYLLDEWRRLRRVSASTERRMREKGIGPKLTHLSAGRLGVRVCDDRLWLEQGGAVDG